ncbi:hypothetical protein ABZV80_40950 [Streptomyces sp. NPDC005132]|uniref:hypothetical protein n=1 Tax=Streptomyces sp. NPDC005132 TaxID=3154294 RepID=UPI0033A03128
MPAHHDVQGNSPRPASARERMAQALTRYGITAHADRDAGNSWLQVNIRGHDFPDAGAPVLTAYVYDLRDDTTFVDQPMEHRPGTWRVTFATDGRERNVFYGQRADPQTATAQCAAFIAGYCSALRTSPLAWPALLEATDRLRDAAGALARLIADTLTAQFDVAAYLILEDDEHGDALWLHSVLDASGRTLFTFSDGTMLPAVADDSPLRAAWGQLNPGDPASLEQAVHGLRQARAIFDHVPDDLLCDAITDDHSCLLLSTSAHPGCWDFGWDFDGDDARRLVRPYSAPRPPVKVRAPAPVPAIRP